jgi:hypothetical protein
MIRVMALHAPVWLQPTWGACLPYCSAHMPTSLAKATCEIRIYGWYVVWSPLESPNIKPKLRCDGSECPTGISVLLQCGQVLLFFPFGLWDLEGISLLLQCTVFSPLFWPGIFSCRGKKKVYNNYEVWTIHSFSHILWASLKRVPRFVSFSLLKLEGATFIEPGPKASKAGRRNRSSHKWCKTVGFHQMRTDHRSAGWVPYGGTCPPRIKSSTWRWSSHFTGFIPEFSDVML